MTDDELREYERLVEKARSGVYDWHTSDPKPSEPRAKPKKKPLRPATPNGSATRDPGRLPAWARVVYYGILAALVLVAVALTAAGACLATGALVAAGVKDGSTIELLVVLPVVGAAALLVLGGKAVLDRAMFGPTRHGQEGQLDQSAASSQPSAGKEREEAVLLRANHRQIASWWPFLLIALLVLCAWAGYSLSTALVVSTGARVVGGLSLTAVGLMTVLMRRQQWIVRFRLAGAVACLALLLFAAAVGSWLSGLSASWDSAQAERLVAELNALAPGDCGGYWKNQQARQQLVLKSPRHQDQIQQAQADWRRRSTEKLLRDLAEQPAGVMDGWYPSLRALEQLAELCPDGQPEIEKGKEAWGADTAARQVAELQQVGLGDLAGYTKGIPARRELAGWCPAVRDGLEAAERTWGERTADAELAGLRTLAPGDVASFDKGWATRKELCRLLPALGALVQKAEADWAERTVAAALAEVEMLRKTDPAEASTLLQQAAKDLASRGAKPAAQKQLLAARRRVLADGLVDIRREILKHIKQDRFLTAAEAAKHFADTFGSEATTVGLGAELATFRASYQFLAGFIPSTGETDPR
jgi:hypothetical protein